jgi:hypothetical protein
MFMLGRYVLCPDSSKALSIAGFALIQHRAPAMLRSFAAPLDPLVESPASVLDRKHEIRSW